MPTELQQQVHAEVARTRARSRWRVRTILTALGVSPSSYYRWLREEAWARALPAEPAKCVQPYAALPEEKEAIRQYARQHPALRHRELAWRMVDEDVTYVSPSTVYRVLKEAGRLKKWTTMPSSKGSGFRQPQKGHQHWHIDIAYLNICGTFYYLCSLLDGYSRFVVHWEIREQMTEQDVELVIQRAREKFPQAKPRIISDNGPQFVAKDFKVFIRLCGMTHVRTSFYYPQSNGKLERWHKTVKGECIRPGTPLFVEDARRLVAQFVAYYNNERLHSAIGYITPQDKLAGREQEIFAERRRKLEKARENRRRSQQQMNQEMVTVEG